MQKTNELNYTNTNGEQAILHYTKTLSLAELESAVEFIARAVVDENYDYHPYLIGLAQSHVLLTYYTDLADGLNETELGARYGELIETIDAIKEELLAHIDVNSWVQVVQYSTQLIEHRKNVRPVDKVAVALAEMITQFVEILGALSGVSANENGEAVEVENNAEQLDVQES